MERTFVRKLAAVQEQLVKMGEAVDSMIENTIGALVDRRPELLDSVLRREEEIDLQCIAVDDECVTLLATQGFVATDLRFVLAAAKVNGSLERIADQAVAIAFRARGLNAQPELKGRLEIPRMAHRARSMLSEALGAFGRKDVDAAWAVIRSDRDVDVLRDQALRELLACMTTDQTTIARALDLIFVARSLEAIADLASDIAEQAIFYACGEDVRARRDLRKELRASARSSAT